MGAELRIENEALVREAEELAGLLKMSVSDAADAVRAPLDRERDVQARTAALLALGREIREHLIEPLSLSDIDDMLYGPDGLPA